MENSLWAFQWLYWGNLYIIVAKCSIKVEYFRGGGELNTWSTGKFCGKRQPLHHAVSWMFLTNSALCHLTVLRLILKGVFSIHLFWFDPHNDLAAFRTTNKVHFPWQDKSFCLYEVYTFCRDSGNWGKESQLEIYVSFFVLTGYIELNFYICITRLM